MRIKPIKDSSPSNPPQDSPTAPTSSQTNQPHSFTRISWVENLYALDERLATLSEPLTPAIRQAPISELQCEPTYDNLPLLQKDLNRTRQLDQNQNLISTIDRQTIHPDAIET